MSDIVYSDGYREVRRCGEPTAGGAYSNYIVLDSSFKRGHLGTIYPLQDIHFQSNTVENVGVEGVTNEALLSIVADRLHSFQQGEFPCEYNQEALYSIQEALESLEARTIDRKGRGVEGKHEE